MKPDKRFYVGRRAGRTEVYVVTPCDVEPLRPRVHRSDAAFAWGSDADPGGIELAFAILCRAGRGKPRDRVCTQFHDEVIAALPHAGFVLDGDDVARARLGAAGRGGSAACDETRRTWRQQPACPAVLGHRTAAMKVLMTINVGTAGVAGLGAWVDGRRARAPAGRSSHATRRRGAARGPMTDSKPDRPSRLPSDQVDDSGCASFPSDPPSGWAGRDDAPATRRPSTAVPSGLGDPNPKQRRSRDQPQQGSSWTSG